MASTKPSTGADRSRESRSSEKRAAIIDAATAAFLQRGYLATSVDEIAKRAGVSKQTVYEHFGGKERLFTEIVVGTIDQVGQPFFTELDSIEEVGDLAAGLGTLARELIGIVMEPRLLELRRVVIGELARFPELGRIYYERGPARTVDALGSMIERLAERGFLRVEDRRLAAEHFNWLVLSVPINRAMFSPDVNFSPEELGHYADEAVRVFLAAYG